MDLVECLKRPEGKTLEFKRSLASPDGILRSLVAFANTAGGVLLIGVEDITRRVRGVKDPLALEERLANLISDSISPRLVPSLEIHPWRQTHVVMIEVYPSSTKPHHLNALGPKQGVFVRVGSTNRRADESIIQEMQRSTTNVSFDEEPMPDLDSEAIDFRVASELFAPNRKLKRSNLQSLQITTRHQGREVPTKGGLLLFGKDRIKYFPDAWIHAGLFRGSDRRQILDSSKIHSPLPQAIEEAITFIERNTSRQAEIGRVRRTDRPAFPPQAIREVIVNAVVHADYAQRGAPIRISIFEDRIEIENPGLLPFGLTLEDIQQGISKIRNRVIARVFHSLGYIEQWGSGIQRMIAACQDRGLGPPMFEEIGIHFRVTISTAQRQAPALDEIDQSILDALAKSRGLSTKEIGRLISKSPRATRTRLISLIERGHVVEIGSGPNDPKRRYYLAGSKLAG